MKHLEALRILPSYFESELDRETIRAFHGHIKNCSDCRDQIKLMRQFKERSNTKTKAKETPEPVRNRRRVRPSSSRKLPHGSSILNAGHLKSRRVQRSLALKYLVSAVLFFFAVRFGLFEMIFK